MLSCPLLVKDEPDEIGAVGGGWFSFAQPEVNGQFGPAGGKA
jgi:hypothetical protein